MKEFWLGVTFSLRPDDRTRARLVAMIAAISICTLLLLCVAAIPNVMSARTDRIVGRSAAAPSPGQPTTWMLEGSDVVAGRPVVRNVVAGDGPLPPGLTSMPRPGDAIVSPALAKLIRSEPALKDRYPSDKIITPSGLAGPDELVAWVGAETDEVARHADALAVTAFGGAPGTAPSAREGLADLQRAAGAMVALLLVLLLTTLTAAVRLSSRSQGLRLSALRLAGATIEQCTRVVVGEVTLAAVGGAVAGWAAFALASHTFAAEASLAGVGWFAGDLSAGGASLAVPVLVVLLAYWVATKGADGALRNALATRRGGIPQRRSRAVLSVLAAGLGALALGAVGGPFPPNLAIRIALGGFLVTLIATPLAAAPLVAALAGRATSRPASVTREIAFFRLRQDPATPARASAVLALAIVAVGLVGSVNADRQGADTEYLSPRQFNESSAVVRVDGSAMPAAELPVGVPAASLDLAPLAQSDGFDRFVWVGDCGKVKEVLGAEGDCGRDGATLEFPGRGAHSICDDAGCRPIQQVNPGSLIQIGSGQRATPMGKLALSRNISVLPQLFYIVAVSDIRPEGASRTTLFGATATQEQELRRIVWAQEPTAVFSSERQDLAIGLDQGRLERAFLVVAASAGLFLAIFTFLLSGIDALADRERSDGALTLVGAPQSSVRAIRRLYLGLSATALSILGAVTALLANHTLQGATENPSTVPATILIATPLAVVGAWLVATSLACKHQSQSSLLAAAKRE